MATKGQQWTTRDTTPQQRNLDGPAGPRAEEGAAGHDVASMCKASTNVLFTLAVVAAARRQQRQRGRCTLPRRVCTGPYTTEEPPCSCWYCNAGTFCFLNSQTNSRLARQKSLCKLHSAAQRCLGLAETRVDPLFSA